MFNSGLQNSLPDPTQTNQFPRISEHDHVQQETQIRWNLNTCRLLKSKKHNKRTKAMIVHKVVETIWYLSHLVGTVSVKKLHTSSFSGRSRSTVHASFGLPAMGQLLRFIVFAAQYCVLRTLCQNFEDHRGTTRFRNGQNAILRNLFLRKGYSFQCLKQWKSLVSNFVNAVDESTRF